MFLKKVEGKNTELREIDMVNVWVDEENNQMVVDTTFQGVQKAFVLNPSRNQFLYLMNDNGKTIDSWCF